MGESFDLEQKGGFSFTREAYDWVESAVTALLLVVLIFVLLGMVISVNGSSMVPTLQDRDRLICLRMVQEPEYGDIVVITKPDSRNNPLIKRVIATSGQTIDFDMASRSVIVDGAVLEEDYIREEMDMYQMDAMDMYPFTVPDGHVFVMGDNRNNSWDSRVPEVGAIDVRYIFGHVVYRIMPYDKMGRPS